LLQGTQARHQVKADFIFEKLYFPFLLHSQPEAIIEDVRSRNIFLFRPLKTNQQEL